MGQTPRQNGTDQFWPDCAAFLGSTRILFARSCLSAYMKSSKKIFGKNTNHIRHIHLAGKSDRDNNNKMERLNGKIHYREKVFRGLKKMDTAILDGMRVYYNYTKKHSGINGMTPPKPH